MTVEDWILIDVASNRNMFFSENTNPNIYIHIDCDDFSILEKYRYFFRAGEIYTMDTGGGNKHSDINQRWGYYKWVLLDEEAYTFCKKLLPHLAKHNQYKFRYCQALMMEYMSRESN